MRVFWSMADIQFFARWEVMEKTVEGSDKRDPLLDS